MSTEGEPGSGSSTGHLQPEMIVEQYATYIIALVRERVYRFPSLFRPTEREMGIEDLAQGVSIKFWLALKERPIAYPRAYLRRIVHSEIIDALRRNKVTALPLPIDEEGEIYAGRVLVTFSEEMMDPAEIYERNCDAEQRLREVVEGIGTLAPRQQSVMMCILRDRVDNPARVTKALEKASLQGGTWPGKREDRQLLQASLPYARHNLSRQFPDGERIQKKYLPAKSRKRPTAVLV